MTSFLRRYSVAGYFALAFAISWGGVFAVIQGSAIPAPSEEAERLFLGVYLAMLAGPSLAGIAMTAAVSGSAGLRDYRSRLLKWRVSPLWYAVALITAPLALTVTALALVPFSGDFVPAVLRGSPLDPQGPVHAASLSALLLMAAGVGIGAGFFEELGWTGFAIPALLRRRSAVATGLLVGVLWGAWHFLAVWWGSARSFGSVPIPLFMIVALFTFLPPYRVLMVRVYQRTGSLLIGIMMHASLTASMIILGPSIEGVQSVEYNLAFAAVLWGMVLLTPQHGRREVPTRRSDAVLASRA
jgi:membrane protease YdiL (CAAX protease family)